MRASATRDVLAGSATATLVVLAGLACEDASSPTLQPEVVAPSFHVCAAGGRFTGGGRIDPAIGKTTFGFNVDGRQACAFEGPIKGQLQVVHHPSQSKYHTTEITEFNSYASPEGGECAEWSGTVRAKHGNDDWHTHGFEAEACDNGEPGSSPGTGPDTFRFTASGHGTTGRTELTGGNIQSH
jgi:hypothetical protein